MPLSLLPALSLPEKVQPGSVLLRKVASTLNCAFAWSATPIPSIAASEIKIIFERVMGPSTSHFRNRDAGDVGNLQVRTIYRHVAAHPGGPMTRRLASPYLPSRYPVQFA